MNSLRELPFPIIAVLPGAETGVELADQLSFRLGLRSNGTAQSLARRNKYVMGETVRNAGVRAVKQATCTSVEEMVAFLDTLRIPGSINNALKCVVKPVQSAGTDDVFLCQSVDEAVTAFDRIYGKVNGIGLMNDCVLVQEFLVGKEYVVDKVSKDGLHKLVAIWEYDKRRVNGANFVYFGMRLKPSDSEMAKVMIPYADKVLDALGIKNGPSHMEVMVNTIVENGVTRYDPCLVEVGARCHGGEGTWLPVAKECVGYNQVMVTLDAYLDCKLFDSIQKDYFPVHKAGREVDMVSRYGGIVRALPGDAAIRKLPSFRSISWEVKPGDYCHKTIDCFTRPGCVQLVAATEADAERDLEAIHDLELFGLIDYAVICPKPPTVGAIVVVDPFSTGAHLAALVLKWGYKLILVFSQLEGHVSNLVAKGNHVNPTLLIQHDSKNANIDAAMAETLAKIESEGSPVLAIISGAESGVTLAGNLALKFGTRANEILDIHTNKHAMQEAVSKVGVRSVDQRLCKNEDEVVSFLAHLKEKTGSTKAVMKPAQSVGADHVTLCSTQGDAVSALHSINGQINQLGNVNDGALLQEYLQGTEFVVDGISRDGVYKIVAIWEYDKRSINGAHFVHFGMRLRDGHDSQLKPLLDYAHKVVTVLKIFQGPTHMKLRLQTNVKEGTIHYDPCLISIGAHCHGGDGTWIPIANECIGYNQVEMTLGCYVRPDRFDSLPAVPRLLFHGSEAFLVAHENGTIHDIPGLDRIRSLSSFR